MSLDEALAKLKPCPFCGAMPGLRRDPSTKLYGVFCHRGHDGCIGPWIWHEKLTTILRWWNQRAGEKPTRIARAKGEE